MTEKYFFDTDCLSAFLWVREESILAKLYAGKIILPAQVYNELQRVPHLLAKVSISDLNYRKGPSTSYDSYDYIPVGVYTIVDEQDGWGLLKAYADQRNGWIRQAQKCFWQDPFGEFGKELFVLRKFENMQGHFSNFSYSR